MYLSMIKFCGYTEKKSCFFGIAWNQMTPWWETSHPWSENQIDKIPAISPDLQR